MRSSQAAFGIELDAERGGEHRGREILGIIAALLGGHAIAVLLGNVAVHLGVARTRKSDAGMDAAAGLVGLGARHDAEGDLAGTQRGDAGFARQLVAMRRQDRRHGDEILLLDIGIAQRQLERGELIAMNADAARQEEAGWNRKHAAASAIESRPAGSQARATCQWRGWLGRGYGASGRPSFLAVSTIQG